MGPVDEDGDDEGGEGADVRARFRVGRTVRYSAAGCRRLLLAGLAATALLAGCSSEPTLETPPIPAFPGPGAAAPTSAPPPRDTIVPTDCDQLLSSEEVPNLLGLPLGTVEVRSVRDVPAPSVQRLERVTCNYTSTGGAGAAPQGNRVLQILSSGYATPEAAQSALEANERQQSSDGLTPVATPIGAARGTFYADPEGALLVVGYQQVATTLTLTRGGDLPAEQSRSLLVDLAQRVLPVLVPTGS